MDKHIVQAYIWQDIVRLGFSPSGTKNWKKWLRLYAWSLKEFWEVDCYPKAPSQSGNRLCADIDCSEAIGMTFEYAVEHDDKFTVRLMYSPPREQGGLLWVHDMDGRYFSFPNQEFLTFHKRRNQALQIMNPEHIGEVVDSLIIHPTPHQHIESPLENHDIRIGGGLMNPFLYLFHLRVQFCPDIRRRMAEKERLVALFDQAIRDNSEIAPSELMKIPN